MNKRQIHLSENTKVIVTPSPNNIYNGNYDNLFFCEWQYNLLCSSDTNYI